MILVLLFGEWRTITPLRCQLITFNLFLRLVNYYQRFIVSYSKMAAQLENIRAALRAKYSTGILIFDVECAEMGKTYNPMASWGIALLTLHQSAQQSIYEISETWGRQVKQTKTSGVIALHFCLADNFQVCCITKLLSLNVGKKIKTVIELWHIQQFGHWVLKYITLITDL